MAIVDVVQGVTLSGRRESPDGKEYHESKTVQYTALAGSATDTEYDVLSHPDCPKLGQAMLGNPWYRCVSVEAHRRSSVLLWDIVAEYESIAAPDKSPIDTAPKINRRTIWVDEPIDTDINGDLICTVNRERYEGITERFPIFVYDVQRAVPMFDDRAWRAYAGSVNNDNWGPFQPGEVLLFDLQADEVSNDDYTYFQVKAEFHTKEPPVGATPAQTWHKRILHQGFYVNTLGSPPSQIVAHAEDDEGNKVTKPVLLDANGEIITDSSNAVWNFYETKSSMSFNALGLL